MKKLQLLLLSVLLMPAVMVAQNAVCMLRGAVTENGVPLGKVDFVLYDSESKPVFRSKIVDGNYEIIVNKAGSYTFGINGYFIAGGMEKFELPSLNKFTEARHDMSVSKITPGTVLAETDIFRDNSDQVEESSLPKLRDIVSLAESNKSMELLLTVSSADCSFKDKKVKEKVTDKKGKQKDVTKTVKAAEQAKEMCGKRIEALKAAIGNMTQLKRSFSYEMNTAGGKAKPQKGKKGKSEVSTLRVEVKSVRG